MADSVTSEELQAELESLAEGMGISIKELLSKYTTSSELNKTLDAMKLDIKKITEVGELDTESIAEKIISINELLENIDGEDLKGLVDSIAANEKAISDLAKTVEDTKVEITEALDAKETRLSNAETKLDGAIKTVEDNKAAQAKINDAMNTITTKTAADVEVLKGDGDGSIVKQVTDAVGAERERTNTLVAGVNGKIDATSEKVNTLETESARVSSILDDSTDEDGNLVEGVATMAKNAKEAAINETINRVKDVENLQEQINNMDGSGLVKGIICGKKAANKFNAIFDLAPFEVCDSGDDEEA